MQVARSYLFSFSFHIKQKGIVPLHITRYALRTRKTFLRITIFELNELLLCKTRYRRGIFRHTIVRIHIPPFLFFIKRKEIIVYTQTSIKILFFPYSSL